MSKLDGFEIKRLLNFGEVRKVRASMSEFAEIQEKLSKEALNENDIKELNNIIIKSGESDQLVAALLGDCLLITQDDLDKMDYNQVVSLFGKLYTESTTIKKKSGEPYG